MGRASGCSLGWSLSAALALEGLPSLPLLPGRLVGPFTSLFIVRPLAYWAPVMPGTKLCPAHVSCILARAVGKGAG